MPKGMTKKQMGGVSRQSGIRRKGIELLKHKYELKTKTNSCADSTIKELLKLYSINSEEPGINNKIINYIINCLINNDYSSDLLNAISERIVSTEGMVFNNNESVRNDNAIYASVIRKSPIDKENLKNKLQLMINPLSGEKTQARASNRTSSSHTPLSSRRSSQSNEYVSIGGARKYRSKKANNNKRSKVCKTKKLRGGGAD